MRRARVGVGEFGTFGASESVVGCRDRRERGSGHLGGEGGGDASRREGACVAEGRMPQVTLGGKTTPASALWSFLSKTGAGRA